MILVFIVVNTSLSEMNLVIVKCICCLATD